jgi:hypothetical protein
VKVLKCLISSILAGLSIGFGGIAYLSVDNKLVGAIFFTIGLFLVCSFGYNPDNLASDMEEMSEMIEQLMKSNNTIVDSVSTLSASGQQITASTEEAAAVSDSNVAIIQDFAAKVRSVSGQMAELRQ